MTTTVVSLRDHLNAVIACLTLAGHTRWHVGNGTAPKDPATQQTYPPPYIVIHALPGGMWDGPNNDPHADVTLPFQATCVAIDQSEAAWLRDEVVAALLTTPVTIPGRHAARNGAGVALDGGPGGVARDDTERPPLFYCTPRFTLSTTP